MPPFLSYSPPGVVAAADLMYANYGTVEDFEELDKRNLNCTGKIVIMRYGKIFRGNKVIFDWKILNLSKASFIPVVQVPSVFLTLCQCDEN